MEELGSKRIDELVRLAMIGDGASFTKLWDTHIDALKTYIVSWVKNIDDFLLDDICSRSFEKAFRQIQTYDPKKSRFSTWLKTIAHNTALDVIERESRDNGRHISIERNNADFGLIDSIADQIDTPLDSIIRVEEEARTSGYIDALPELYRDVARKRMLDGLQYKEIAEELDMELNTVRTRLRRAKALIDKMKDEEDTV